MTQQPPRGRLYGATVRPAKDPALIERALELAETHSRRGAAIVEQQQELVKILAADGHDITLAQQILDTFEQIQRAHLADRDRLAKDLARATDASAPR